MCIATQLKLLLKQGRISLAKTQRHIHLLLSMVRLGLVVHLPKLHTINSLPPKYSGIGAWHKRLAKEVITTGNVRTPSGREFAFPLATRRANGSITYFTQVKNYPVQSFATADIVPVSLIYIDKMLQANKLQSCVVNTVHDSIVIDVHPMRRRR